MSAHQLDDELVLYDARHRRGYVLNTTAARIWALCDGSRTSAAVARAISADYPLAYRRALADVRELIDSLRDAELLAS